MCHSFMCLFGALFAGFGAMDVTKPYKFIGFGAMGVTKPYKFIGFGAILRDYDAHGPCSRGPSMCRHCAESLSTLGGTLIEARFRFLT